MSSSKQQAARPFIECHCATIRQLSRSMTALYDQALQPAGVTLPQFSLLRRLDRHGPLSVSALAELMDLERTTLGRNLKPLQRAALVQSSVNEADTREKIVSVTQAGRGVIARATPMWRRAQHRVEKQVGKTRIQLMHELLEHFELAHKSPQGAKQA